MKKLFFLLLLIISPFVSPAQTNVGGTLSSSTTWELAGSPYNLTSQLIVGEGKILTIEEGVEISGNYELLIQGGAIVAEGTEDEPISFNATKLMFKVAVLTNSSISFCMFSGGGLQLGNESDLAPDPQHNTGTLTVSNSAFSNNAHANTKGNTTTAKLRLVDCSMSDGEIMGFYKNSEPIEIETSTITNTSITSGSYNYGITITETDITDSELYTGYHSKFIISDSEFTGCSFLIEPLTAPADGTVSMVRTQLVNTYINDLDGYFSFDQCNISGNVSYPYMINVGAATITNSTFEGSSTTGFVRFSGVWGYSPYVSTIENVTFDNYNVAVEFWGSYPGSTLSMSIKDSRFLNGVSYALNNNSSIAINARDNYWGTALEGEIPEKIFDYYDNSARGIVDYGDFSLSPVEAPDAPGNIFKGIHIDGILIKWNKIIDENIAGYNIYRASGLDYVFVADAGDVDNFVVDGDIDENFVVTAYDLLADGLDDLAEGHESLKSGVANEFFIAVDLEDETCEGYSILAKTSNEFSFSAGDTFELFVSSRPDLSDSISVAEFSSASSEGYEWSLPDTVSVSQTLHYWIFANELNIRTNVQSILIDPLPVFDFRITAVECSGGKVGLKILPVTEGVEYEWITGNAIVVNHQADTITLVYDLSGEKTVSLTGTKNNCPVIIEKSFDVLVQMPPVFDIRVTALDCPVGTVGLKILSEAEEVEYEWLTGDADVVEEQADSIVLRYNLSGEKTVSLKGTKHSCPVVIGKNFDVLIPVPLQAPIMCDIESEPEVHKTKLSWGYLSDSEDDRLSHFLIYREADAVDSFEKVDSIPTNILTYVDESSHSNERSYRYRISAVDVCGIETDPGEISQTLFLQVTPGEDGFLNLNWNSGRYSEITLMRKTTGDWEEIAELPDTTLTYADISILPGEVSYQAIISMGSTSCRIISNISSTKSLITSVENSALHSKVYPNPVSDFVYVDHPGEGNVQIVDTYGKVLNVVKIKFGINKIDVREFSSGIYLLRINSKGKNNSVRMIKGPSE